jgi:diguanylate cyclase (GGDEF)-like protein/PAS domain S-box-containing protein
MQSKTIVKNEINQLGQVCELWENGVIIETGEGIIASWNKGAQDLFGYSADEAIGKPHSLLVPVDIGDNRPEIIKRIRAGEPSVSFESVHSRKDGSRINVSILVSPLRDDSGEICAFSFLAHNTADREQEKELFTALTQSSPIGICIVQSGKFIYINRQFEKIIGYNINELLSTETLSYVHPDDRTLVRAHATYALKTGVCDPYEYRVVTKSGQIKWILETIMSIHHQGKRAALGNFMDITEMKRLEQETELSNQRLTSVVKQLEEQQRQSAILTEMRDMLQACTRMEETAPIIMGFMKQLFPSSQGALFLLSNSRSDLESIVTWGDFPVSSETNVFPPDACWGLRRGRAHVVDDINVGPVCPHLHGTPSAPYVCLPLMAKGDILGLLHLKNLIKPGDDGQAQIADLKQMALTLSEYLSLSIANVKLSESLSRQSILDAQTGLYNRRFMEESLQREISRAARKQTTIGLIMGDLDHFKKFNDVYGHAAGDKIIVQIGRLLKDKFRGSDIACRYGGEEFLVILPESSLQDTFKRADSLREEIRKMEIVFQGQILGNITISMGVAAYPDKGIRLEELLRVADTALYKAKQEGRDRVISG